MRAAIAWLWVAAAGCYAPHADPGVPCTPQLANCPGDQTCQLVGGDYFCSDRATDAGTDSSRADANGDSGVGTAWTLVQTRSQMAPKLSMPASGAGHLIVVAVQTTSGSAASAVSDNAGNTYVQIAGSRATVKSGVSDLGIELWYAQDSKPGATSISPNANMIFSVTAWEVAGIRTTNPLDQARQLSDQPSTGKPSAPSITTTSAGEFVVAIAIVGSVVNGLQNNSAFTNDHNSFGNGFAHLTSNTAPAGPYQATWNQSNANVFCATAAAFVTGPPK